VGVTSGSDEDHEPLLVLDDNQVDGEPPGSGNVIGVGRGMEAESRTASMTTDLDAAVAVIRGSEERPARQAVRPCGSRLEAEDVRELFGYFS
jgi:hypothetical protein